MDRKLTMLQNLGDEVDIVVRFIQAFKTAHGLIYTQQPKRDIDSVSRKFRLW